MQAVESDHSSGLQFQTEVAELFRLSGYGVTENILVGHKKVDILLRERRLGKSTRIAVECKGWQSVLTQSEVSKIYSNYLPLIPEHVDEVLIVTQKGIAESAKAMIARSPQLRTVTYSEIHANIMDFTAYLQAIIDQYEDDGLHCYYVPPVSSDGADLTGIVDEWLKEDNAPPLALLGSYGIGKTTFARRFARDLAIRAKSDQNSRIPILVRLGDISNEQSLEGLFGKLFTATSLVRNYSFSAFLKLNQMGRFVVVLDGFDEMRQSISWSDFRYNFAQISRLVSQYSKVILLGRPTAFLTDAEQNFALHGLRPLGGRDVRDPALPDYREVAVGGFTQKQVEEFLPLYLSYLAETARTDAERLRYEGFRYDAADLRTGAIADIVRRPVQLKMLTEILPDYQGKGLGSLTVHDLYDYFVDYVIERETSKPDRGRFKPAERRAFARDIALWLWRRRGDLTVSIPTEVVQRYRSPGEDLEVITRDLVVASLLDRGLGHSFFFPHRSFQEFLVAEALYHEISSKSIDLSDLNELMTPEIYEFLNGFVDRKFMMAVSPLLEPFRGSLPLSFIRCLLAADHPLQYFTEASGWGLLVTACAVKFGVADASILRKRIHEGYIYQEPRHHIVAIFAALIGATYWRNTLDDEPSNLVTDAIEQAIKFASNRYRIRDSKKERAAEGYSASTLIELIKSLNYADRSERGDLHVAPAYRHIHSACRNTFYISDWTDGQQLDYRRADLPERVTDYRQRSRYNRNELLELIQRASRLRKKQSGSRQVKTVEVVTRKFKWKK